MPEISGVERGLPFLSLQNQHFPFFLPSLALQYST